MFTISRKGFGFDSEKIAFSLDYGKLYMRYGGFEFGEISKHGIIRTLSSLHDYSEFDVAIGKFGRNDRRYGFKFTLDKLTFFYLRSMVGVQVSSSNLDFFYLYKESIKGEENVILDYDKSSRNRVMYLGGKLSLKYLSLSAVTSFDDSGNFKSFLSTRISAFDIFLDLRVGNIFPLRMVKDLDIFSISYGIRKRHGGFSWRYKYGSEPIYTNTYMARRSDRKVFVDIGSGKLSAEGSAEFLRDGNIRRSYGYSFEYDVLSISYSTEKGLSHRVDLGISSILLSKDSIAVNFDIPLKKDNIDIMIAIRKFEFDVKLSIEIT